MQETAAAQAYLDTMLAFGGIAGPCAGLPLAQPDREWRVAVISDLWPKTAGCGQMRQTEVDLDGVIQ